MRTYVIRRLLLFIPTLFIVSMLVFLSVRLLPGDFVDLLLSDPMSRNIYGARLSLLVGFAATTVAVLVATVVGGLSGFVGGRLDLLTQRFVDAWMAFPCEPGGSGTVAVVGEGDVARTGAGFLIVGCVTKCRGPLPGGGVCVLGGRGYRKSNCVTAIRCQRWEVSSRIIVRMFPRTLSIALCHGATSTSSHRFGGIRRLRQRGAGTGRHGSPCP